MIQKTEDALRILRVNRTCGKLGAFLEGMEGNAVDGVTDQISENDPEPEGTREIQGHCHQNARVQTLPKAL